MDTDQIIPARFLKKDRAQGYGQYLFLMHALMKTTPQTLVTR
jgi:3-isopropylmalate dehydratase small subunit